MYSRILLATDGSDLSLAACEHGLRLAKSLGVGALAVYASPPFDVPTGFEFVPAPLLPVDVYVESTRAAAKKNLGADTALAKTLGVDCDTRHLRSLPPAEAIVAAAKTGHCDLIVLGSHGRGGFGQMVLGSVTTRVLATCAIPVLVHREVKRARKRKARR